MKIGILGGAESGIGAALLATLKGDEAFVSEYRNLADEDKELLLNNKIRFEEGGHSFEILAACDLIVKSPGISSDVPVVRSLKVAGLEIISELEYAFRKKGSGAIVAITGSNGKTTTTNLCHCLLQYAGIQAVKGGNLGTCFSKLLLEKPAEVYVLEVSSFQLDDINSFRADIAVILNITEDHLDRYGYSLMNYAASKFRICKFQTAGDKFLFLADDPVSRRAMDQAGEIRSQIIEIHLDSLAAGDFQILNPALRGEHNAINASFAIEVARLHGVKDEDIAAGLESFVNDDHRMQSVVRLDEVEWINDSKATNVDSAYYALKAIDTPIVWIAGGQDKGNDYSKLYELYKEKVKNLICLGVDNRKLIENFSSFGKEIVEAGSMAEALALADRISEPGDTVLLSPACASFDLFKNYKDRGEQFVEGVWNLLRVTNG